MPKNKGAGGKNRRKGKTILSGPKDLTYKSIGEEYAQITKSLGNGYMEVICFTSEGKIPKRAHIRGSMRKKVWLSIGDIVLISERGYEDKTCDILLKYTSDQAKILRNRGELPENIDINKNDPASNDMQIVFNDNMGETNTPPGNSKREVPTEILNDSEESSCD